MDRTANTIEGTSEPGAVVVVFIEPDTGPLAGQFTMFRSVAGPEGHWRVETSDAVDLRDEHDGISARIEDPDGDSALGFES